MCGEIDKEIMCAVLVVEDKGSFVYKFASKRFAYGAFSKMKEIASSLSYLISVVLVASYLAECVLYAWPLLTFVTCR